ncbi:MAG: N-6 DNA methylase, partial [Sediminibacterium sp.]
MGYNSRRKLEDNVAAIRIALQWKMGDVLQTQQVKALEKYSGFGGLKVVLFPNEPVEAWEKLNASKEDIGLHPLVMELHELLENNFSAGEYKQVVDSLRNSVLSSFYTPGFVPDVLFGTLKELGINAVHLYEPSAGA